MTEQPFKVGDTVRLKSSGPLMTVDAIKDDSDGRPQVWCVWFDSKDNEQRKPFRAETLRADDGMPHFA